MDASNIVDLEAVISYTVYKHPHLRTRTGDMKIENAVFLHYDSDKKDFLKRVKFCFPRLYASTNRTCYWNQLIYWVRWRKQATWKMLFPTKAIFIQLVITNHTSARDDFHFVRFCIAIISLIYQPNARIQLCVCVCIYILYIYIYIYYLSNLSYKLQLFFPTNMYQTHFI